MVAPVVAAALIGGAMGLGTAAYQSSQISGANKQSRKFAREVRDYETEMANTAVRRHAADLEGAGLNRILAVSGGGAATPSPPMAQSLPEIGTSDPVSGASSAVGALVKEQELKIMKEQEKLVHEQYLSAAEQTDMLARQQHFDSLKRQWQNANFSKVEDSWRAELDAVASSAKNLDLTGRLQNQALNIGHSAEAASQIDTKIFQELPFLRVLDAVSRSVQGAGSSAVQVKRFLDR